MTPVLSAATVALFRQQQRYIFALPGGLTSQPAAAPLLGIIGHSQHVWWSWHIFVHFCISLRHIRCVQSTICYGWGMPCLRSGLGRREPRNGENWRCPSNRGGGGIFEKLQATPVSMASTRSRQKPCRCKKPAIVAGGQKVAGNFNYGAILR